MSAMSPRDALPPSAPPALRRGWTTGACATAATWGAVERLWGGAFPDEVGLVLPRGETPRFALTDCAAGAAWAECGVVKDAGDDPDVTHGVTVRARVASLPGAPKSSSGRARGWAASPAPACRSRPASRRSTPCPAP